MDTLLSAPDLLAAHHHICQFDGIAVTHSISTSDEMNPGDLTEIVNDRIKEAQGTSPSRTGRLLAFIGNLLSFDLALCDLGYHCVKVTGVCKNIITKFQKSLQIKNFKKGS